LFIKGEKMKSFVTTLILVSAAGIASAQQAAQTHADAAKLFEEARAKIVGEVALAGVHGQTKGVPFSAEEVNDSVQTLADGNRIVRSSTGKIYRNSEGRVRREMSGGTGGMLGTTFSVGQGVSIVSPDQSVRYLLDSQQKTARVFEMPAQAITTTPGRVVAEGRLLPEGTARATEERAKIEATIARSGSVAVAGQPLSALSIGGPAAFTFSTGGQQSTYESKTEELGTRDFDGVSATGTRRTTTIPAGSIGNERPIEIVYERWFSKDLGMVVYSKNSDPRFGEQTYKMTNIVRSEPDPSLFSIPTEYRKVSEPGTFYRLDTTTNTSKTPVPAKVVTVANPAKPARP
jgi:hypothetical protein